MRENEITVQFNRLLVILGSFCEFSANEMKLSTVVVDVWIFGIMLYGCFEIAGSRLTVT
jgi:hypothetical protein